MLPLDRRAFFGRGIGQKDHPLQSLPGDQTHLQKEEAMGRLCYLFFLVLNKSAQGDPMSGLVVKYDMSEDSTLVSRW